ncbi:helix-turn-helix domain-containing protein [Xenorhabdus sp. SGI246]
MNNNVKNDWHQADIIAALRKRGTTLDESGLWLFDRNDYFPMI